MEVGRVTGEPFQQAEDSGSYLCVTCKGLGLLHAEVFPLLSCLSTPVVAIRHI